MGKRITVCLPDVEVDGKSFRPIGSWIAHPLVIRDDSIGRVMWKMLLGISGGGRNQRSAAWLNILDSVNKAGSS